MGRRLKQAAVGFMNDATSGKMPGPYTLVRPETRLSAQDIETICVAARQAEANTADGRRER